MSHFTGPQVLQQLHSQLNPIPEEVLGVGAEIMARRIDLLNLLRGKHRTDRATYLTVSNNQYELFVSFRKTKKRFSMPFYTYYLK